MKTFSEEALAALERGDAVVGGAVAVLCDPAIRVFSGYGTIEIGGEPFVGIGDRGLAQVSAGALGGAAQSITLSLSGIEQEVLDLLDAEEIKRAPVIIWRLIWAGDGKSLLGGFVFARGRVDQVLTEDVIGGTATIKVVVENAARGLGRSGGRMRTDADQRLIKPNDGFFRNVSYAAEKMLYWGGKRPARAGTALGGGGFGRIDQPMDRL